MKATLPMLASLPAADAERSASKELLLLAELRSLGSAIVAFSGGVDSTYLAWAAHRALGAGALAVTALSDSVARSQRASALALAARIGVAHELVHTGETADPRYLANSGDRCYWCKGELYARLAAMAEERGIAAVLDGTNTDDLGDYRPGRRAAEEHGVRSPLVVVGLDKAEVRYLSRRADLPTWSEPASPCLSSRVPHGTPIAAGMLHTIDRAEEAVRALGFREFRVRHLGAAARIEIAEAELARALATECREQLEAAVRGAGFPAAHVDREPFRSGRLNEARERLG